MTWGENNYINDSAILYEGFFTFIFSFIVVNLNMAAGVNIFIGTWVNFHLILEG